MKSPSRMEFFIWGLLSLLPQVIAYQFRRNEITHTIGWLTFCSLPGTLALATGRVSHSIRITIEVFVYLLLAKPFIFIFTVIFFEIDNRIIPQMTWLLPYDLDAGNPVRNTEVNWIAAGCVHALVDAAIVRFAIRNMTTSARRQKAIRWSTGIFGLLLLLNLILEPYAMNKERDKFGVLLIVNLYVFMLAFGLYFVALFYDFSSRLHKGTELNAGKFHSVVAGDCERESESHRGTECK